MRARAAELEPEARIGISNARPVQGCPPPVARNQPYVASKLRGRVPCLGYSGRRCASAQGPRPLTDRRPQRAAPPASHPLCRSLELRTSRPRPPPSPAHGIATHPPVHSRLGCSGGWDIAETESGAASEPLAAETLPP